MPLSFHRALISARSLVDWYVSGEWFHGNHELLNDRLFHARREEGAHVPNYVHEQCQKAAWEGYIGEKGNFRLGPMLIHSMYTLADHFLEIRHERVYTRIKHLADWQLLLTHCNPLPLLAAFVEKEKPELQAARALLAEMLRFSTLPPTLDPKLEALCQLPWNPHTSQIASTAHSRTRPAPRVTGSLYELHMHWNGTTEAGAAWLDCLSDPLGVTRELCEKWRTMDYVRRYWRQHHLANPNDFYRYFKLAAWLRKWIAAYIVPVPFSSDPKDPKTGLTPASLNHGLHFWGDYLGDIFCYQPPLQRLFNIGSHPLRYFASGADTRSYTDLQLEGDLLLQAIRLIRNGHTLMPYLVHAYLILQNTFTHMVVQQASQIGFDQFQAIADFGMRDRKESETYEERFRQLHGMHGPSLGYVEGRVAPKDTCAKMARLLERVDQGYQAAMNKNNGTPAIAPLEIGLIAHFIKRRDESNGSCRHSKLRINTYKQARRLVYVLKGRPKDLSRLIVGKDAAANEMHTPPEVFAPVFRFLNSQGITHSTYHAGEDYHHLLSGLRAVDEAIRFLDLRSGDRLGHCTALGISPVMWRERMSSEKIYCSQGEWLDSLVWAYHRLRELPEHAHILRKFADEIQRLFRVIYKDDAPDMDILITAWEMRKLDALLLCKCGPHTKINPRNFEPHQQRELELLLDQQKKNPEAFKLFRMHHNLQNPRIRDKFDKEFDKPHDIPSDWIPDDVFFSLQDAIVEETRRRNVLIEVMPTSNVRISFYQEYKDHHMLLWLDPENHRPKPQITIATDDPGIFATTLRNEYSHLIYTLRNKGVSADDAYKTAETLMLNARAFRFYLQR